MIVGKSAGEMPCRIDISAPRSSHRKAQRMLNYSALAFIVTYYCGKDRQPRRVRRCPTFGAQLVQFEVKDRGLCRFPSVVCLARLIKLVEQPAHRINHNAMPVARTGALNIGERGARLG